MNVVGIDPGKRTNGYAIFKEGVLTVCGLAKPEEIAKDILSLFPLADEEITVVTERMQVYKFSPVRNADLTDLLLMSGYMAGRVHASYPLLTWLKPEPREWKGNTPKKIHHRRVMKKLSLQEQAAASVALENVPESLQHNVWDAIGLGLWGMKR